jgi:hypothetical protein
MSLTVTKVDVWGAPIQDQPGGLAKVLGAVADAGANLECVIARRGPAKSDPGVAFLTPLKGAKVQKAAKAEGLGPIEKVATLKVEGDDAPGLAFQITSAVANAGVNLRGFSGASLGGKFVIYLGFDEDAEATKAARVLRSLGAAKKPAKPKRG